MMALMLHVEVNTKKVIIIVHHVKFSFSEKGKKKMLHLVPFSEKLNFIDVAPKVTLFKKILISFEIECW